MTVADKVAQKQEDHHDHQRDRQHQLELNVLHRRANRDRAIGQDRDIDRRRQCRFATAAAAS